MNLGTRGVSWSLGPRGASINVSRRGTYLNTGIPGTGLSSRQRVDSGSRSSSEEPLASSFKITGKVTEDGQLQLMREDGAGLTAEHYALCLKQHKFTLIDFLQREAAEREQNITILGTLHEQMPDARKPLRYRREPFAENPPGRPLELPPKAYGLLERLMKSWRARVDEENEARKRDNADALARWQGEVAAVEARALAHKQEQDRLKQLFEDRVRTDAAAMSDALETRLQVLEWPRETLVSFDIRDGGGLVLLDVDLPEIEDMPRYTYAVLKRDMMLAKKDISDKRVRELYMRHVHALGLRLLGEVFATLPACTQVVLSAYSQRPNAQTGKTEDQYLYSLRVPREKWLKLNFDDLAHLDPVQAFEIFDARREVAKSGIFKPVQPFAE